MHEDEHRAEAKAEKQKTKVAVLREPRENHARRLPDRVVK